MTVDYFNKLRISPTFIRYGAKKLTTALDAILPLRCCLCLVSDTGGFCHQCQDLLPWLEIACERCGCELQHAGTCGICQTNPMAFDSAAIPFKYRDPISSQIQRLKYHRGLAVAPALGKMLAMQVIKQSHQLPDALVPVPLHIDRLKQRGFNQAKLIAESAGHLLGIPVDNQIISRTLKTASQTDLDRRSREKNMRNAFAVQVKGRYDAVAVVDDVITSGATMGTICMELRLNGYSRISAWAIART
ncbi:MAG: ComF family protein [bacterium]